MEAKPGPSGQIRAQDVRGLKYFDQLAPLLQRLHDAGCARDRAGNRSLHFDEYGMLVLLFLFNPMVTSLRGLQQASGLKKVQKRLGCPRTSLGSLSESVDVFDPRRLQEIRRLPAHDVVEPAQVEGQNGRRHGTPPGPRHRATGP